MVILLLPKNWHTKWIEINNRDGPFSALLQIGHITGRSIIWLMCNTPILIHIGSKIDVLWCGLPPLAYITGARIESLVLVYNVSFKAHLSNHLIHVCVSQYQPPYFLMDGGQLSVQNFEKGVQRSALWDLKSSFHIYLPEGGGGGRGLQGSLSKKIL